MQCNDYHRSTHSRWSKSTDLPCQNQAYALIGELSLCPVCLQAYRADHPEITAIDAPLKGYRDNLGELPAEDTQMWCKVGKRYGEWFIVRLNGGTVVAAAHVTDAEDADNARHFGFINDGMLVVDMNNHRSGYQLLSEEIPA